MSGKRKSRGADAPVETPDSKRHKAISEAAAEETFEHGTALLNHLKVARDKRNHLISTDFETLPGKKEHSDYYDVIKLPLALDTIERKLDRREYPNLTTLESDFKRMVANAKAYNDKSSDVVADAEKIRKLVSNFMVKKNPAYKDPEYSAFATPILGENEASVTPSRKRTKAGATQDEASEEQEEANSGPPPKKQRVLKLRGPRAGTEAKEESPAPTPTEEASDEDDEEGDEPLEGETTVAGESFEGNTFQQAQQKLITELLEYTNDEGVEISAPFVNLPPRSLKDYYQAIKTPVSLKGVQKRIRGVRGRDKATGVSFFKSWQSFEDELDFVWENARLYNKDGSDIFEAANELEAIFKKRLEEARATVREPSQPKVTLRVPAKEDPPSTKLKLHLSSRQPAPGSGGVVVVDQEALKRQKELVTAGSSGQPRPMSGGSGKSAEAQPSTNADALVNGVKGEVPPSQSPTTAATTTMEAARPASGVSEGTPVQNGSMPPPSLPPHASGSPMPVAQKPPPPAPKDPYELRTRAEGKGIADALFTNFTIATHPSLRAMHNRRYDFHPSPTLTQQSTCIHFEHDHTLLQVAVVLPAALAQRPHKHVLKLNRQMLHPVQARMEDVDPRALIYEVNLVPGAVNPLELEVLLCQSTRGQPKIGPGADYEYERFSVFANVYPP